MAADFFSRGASPDRQDDPGVRVTLPQVRALVSRHRWAIAGVFFCTLIGTYAALSLTTELYEARAALLVKLGRENLDAPPTARNAVFSTGVRREELGSEVHILRSADLIGQVVDEIGVEAFRPKRVPPPDLLGQAKFYSKAAIRWVRDRYQDALIALDLKKRLSEREAAVAYLIDELTADPQKDSDVIAMRLRMADPQLAVQIQETLIQRYLARRLQVRRDVGVKEFFEREVTVQHDALRQAEQIVNDWKRQGGLTLPTEQKALLLRQIRELSAQRQRASSQAEALSRERTAAQGLIDGADEHVRSAQVETPDRSIEQVRERLVKLESDRARLLTTYTQSAAPVAAVEAEITSLTTLLASKPASQLGSVTTEINPLRQTLQQAVNQQTVQLEGVTAEAAAQGRELERLQAELARVAAADARLAELERERLIAEQRYTDALKRLQDADIEAALDLSRISNVSIAMPPHATIEPVYPRKMLLMAIALVVGLALGLGLAIVLEWTSDTLHGADDIESKTDLVCLGAFEDQRRRRLRGVA